MKKLRSTKITLKVKPLRKGHQPHRSGAGAMADRRTGRMKTRANQNKKAIEE